MELYNTCARLIERGKTNGMQKKLDIFFANDRLTEEVCSEFSRGGITDDNDHRISAC